VIGYAFWLQATTLVDSQVPTTREFWRKKYFSATEDEAHDPRPFAEVLVARVAAHKCSKSAPDTTCTDLQSTDQSLTSQRKPL
jgi:hypothetical protein